MFNFLAMAIENDLIYIGIIIVLVIIIILTIISIRSDSKKKVKVNKPTIEPAKTEEEKQHAKLELEKVVSEMQKNLDAKNVKKAEYEEENEEDAIISYQELVKSVKNENTEVHKEVGMEVADKNIIDDIENIDDELVIPSMEFEETNIPTFDIEQPLISQVETKVEEPKVFQEERKFRSTEFISPIYGRGPQANIKKETVNNDVSMDNIIDESFDEEDEFLDSLKGFRKNL